MLEESKLEGTRVIENEYIGRMTKREMVKRLISFFNKCLRVVRAYNFNATLVETSKSYFDYLYTSNYILDK